MLRRCVMAVVFLALSIEANASDFLLTDTQGRTHTLESDRGKWVLVNLWATWCAPCLAEMPELEALHRSRGDLIVLGVAVDGQNARRVTQFAEKLNITYPIIAGNAAVAQQFKPKGFPTSILYDPMGKQLLLKEGSISQKQILSILDQRIQQ